MVYQCLPSLSSFSLVVSAVLCYISPFGKPPRGPQEICWPCGSTPKCRSCCGGAAGPWSYVSRLERWTHQIPEICELYKRNKTEVVKIGDFWLGVRCCKNKRKHIIIESFILNGIHYVCQASRRRFAQFISWGKT